MTRREARIFIEHAVPAKSGTWADIGAGTGVFTQALFDILPSGKVYAVDKSPHALWRLTAPAHVSFEIIEADFNSLMGLPDLDGILMANALHYSPDHERTLTNVISCLRPGARFILIEYDLETVRPPWIPYPLPKNAFAALCRKVGLTAPELVSERLSEYNAGRIYCTVSFRI